eukprot:Hpha_TRINITY_DN27017_c0_g1::TRINITY_DN27017_c0_g1_i1::g.33149::m.33149
MSMLYGAHPFRGAGVDEGEDVEDVEDLPDRESDVASCNLPQLPPEHVFYAPGRDPTRFAGAMPAGDLPHVGLLRMWLGTVAAAVAGAATVVHKAATQCCEMLTSEEVVDTVLRSALPPLRIMCNPQHWIGLRNLPEEVTKQQLRFLFGMYFTVLRVRFFFAPPGSGNGLERLPFAAVQLKTGKEVHEALDVVWVIDGERQIGVIDASG